MAFVQVDPSQIKFDMPNGGGSAPAGFLPVDPSKIQFDSPTSPGSGFFSPNRWAEGEQAANDYVAGKITAPEMLLAATGKVFAGSAMDRLGQGLSAITPEPIKQGLAAGMQGLQSGANAVAGALDNTRAGQAIDDTLMQGQDWYKAHPRLARNVESAADIAQVIPAVKGISGAASLAGDVLQNTGRGLEGLSDLYANKYPVVGTGPVDALEVKVNPYGNQPTGGLSSSNVKDIAGRSFGAADSVGAVLKPEAADSWLNRSAALIPQSERGVAASGEDAATKFINSQTPFKGKPMSLAEAQELYTNLGDKIDGETDSITGQMTNAGRNLYKMQQDLRNTLTNANPDDLIGGNDGIKAWREGQQVWTIKTRMGDIERMLAKASAADVPSTAIKNAFKNYVNRPGNLNGLPDAVKADLQAAAKTGILTGALKTIGSKFAAGIGGSVSGGTVGFFGGGPVGAVVGAPLGAAVTAGAGYPARAAATALQRRPVISALNRLGNSPVLEQATNASGVVSAPTMQQIMAMPPAQARAALNALKAAKAPTKIP